ncbi:MMPL family transporter [Streptomyces pactum]|uniref:Membrane transport protein MMPL domain-containing protein n=1 Tax=Streptomyces pactum TaxID=68249 RepID=A0A1S6JIH1_9ACTN|nr:MMPL family transporter [Streptomyces pactum]AQS71554.1 hypothetical protein B1H29_36085 [Streptomyces pactum]
MSEQPRPSTPGCSATRTSWLAVLTFWAVRNRLRILTATVLFTAVSGFLAIGLPAHLTNGGWLTDNTDSARTRIILRHSTHAGTPEVMLLATSRGSVDNAAARTAGTRLVDQLRHLPGVRGADSYWTGPIGPDPASLPARPVPDPLLRSADSHTALIALWLDGDQRAQSTITDTVLATVTRSSGPLTVQASGEAVVTRALERHITLDMLRMEAWALPITLLLLLGVFGSVLAACLPVAVGVVAITGTAAILRGLTAFTPVSTFALNLTTAVGLALAVDYSLFLVARYREETAAGHPHTLALVRATCAAGRIVVISAATVIASLLGLLLFPLYFLRSFALAGISVVLLASLASLIVIPAALACWGERLAQRDLLARWRRSTATTGRWHRLATTVMRRPLVVVTAVTAVLLLLALPFRHAAFGFSDERALPSHAPEVHAAQTLRHDFPQFRTHIDVVLRGWQPAGAQRVKDLDAYARRLAGLPHVQGLRTATGTYADGKAVGTSCSDSPTQSVCSPDERFTVVGGTWLAISTASLPYSSDATGLVRAIEDVPAPAPVMAGGPTKEFLDSQAAVARALPAAVTVIVLATLLLLFFFTRSLFLPVKALVVNSLSLTATFGAMVFVFQDGHFTWLVGHVTATGTTDLMLPLIAFFLAFGLSMDYEILLLARITEAHQRTRDTVQATAQGLQSAAPLFAASAALVLVVLLAMAAADLATIKLIAVTVALSVFLDVLIIRPLLVPAVMALAGSFNWWVPATLRHLIPSPSTAANVPEGGRKHEGPSSSGALTPETDRGNGSTSGRTQATPR